MHETQWLVGRVSASSVGGLVFKPPTGLYQRLDKNVVVAASLALSMN